MAQTKLTLIRGGLSEDDNRYISGYVTDTGLMGVICMGLIWETPECEELHQFFYFETEEFGFDEYKGIRDLDIQAIAMVEMHMMGGLGGKRVDVTEEEALYLFNKYVDFNRERDLPLPEGEREYRFMIGRGEGLSAEGLEKLRRKIYKEVENAYELINYFLMRVFGGDRDGASYLGAGPDLSAFDGYAVSTLCKNTIDDTEFKDVARCESVIEKDGRYRIVITEIGLSGMEVIGAEVISDMRISDDEARMILSKNEFVTVYDIEADTAVIESVLATMPEGGAVTPFESGNCYIRYNTDNAHVKRRIYWLNEDIFGMYFVSRGGQLVVCAYHEEYIEEIEEKMETGLFAVCLSMGEKYEFSGHVMMDFMQSGMEDFNEYVEDNLEE